MIEINIINEQQKEVEWDILNLSIVDCCFV